MLSEASRPGARVLDVGCGSGYGAAFVSQAMLSSEGSPVYVVCDFSNEMMRMAKQRLEQSDYPLIEGNKLVFDVDTDYSCGEKAVNLDKLVASQGKFRKLVAGYRASGTALPFPDSWFTAYASNLVL